MPLKHRFRANPDVIEQKSMPRESSVIPPLPYFPNLRRALASHGAALLLIYLELYFPAPQDHPDRSVRIEEIQILRDLQLGLSVYQRYRSFICATHQTEAARRGAAMAGREFYRPDKRCCGTWKPYSVAMAGPGVLSLRRNYPKLRSLLDAAGVGPAQLAPFRPTTWANQQGERTTFQASEAGSAHPLFYAHVDGFAEPLEAVVARGPVEAADAAERKLRAISGFADARRGTGIKRKPHTRRPWTEERRAKFDATMQRKRSVADVGRNVADRIQEETVSARNYITNQIVAGASSDVSIAPQECGKTERQGSDRGVTGE